MQILRSLDGLNIESSLATIGSFDGVHLGHQSIIRQLVHESHTAGVKSAVITFFPHPAIFLRGVTSPYYLTSLDERVALLSELGVDIIITLEFNQGLALLSANDFLQKLRTNLGVREVWVGEDFALGRDRQGTVPVLQQIGHILGVSIKVVEPVLIDGQVVSSSLIRNHITQGNVIEAARLLGRRYSIGGEVVHGDGRGHGLGIPTANLGLIKQVLTPANGVYMTWAYLEGKKYQSVTSVGLRPTFEDTPPIPRVEPHLLDFDQNIYGKYLKLEFVEFIRPEIRFQSIDALLDQIKEDIRKTREVLSNG